MQSQGAPVVGPDARITPQEPLAPALQLVPTDNVRAICPLRFVRLGGIYQDSWKSVWEFWAQRGRLVWTRAVAAQFDEREGRSEFGWSEAESPE